MKLLLDTHTFIWWDSDPAKLSLKVLALCKDRANIMLLSVTSVWEMQIKLHLRKLRLRVPLPQMIETQRQTNNIEVLPILLTHVLALGNLPTYHKDPFDRLLICQANIEGAVLVSKDPKFQKYPVDLVW
jgi:PIN domain nuclease of toxin-antitoxin system